jgi:hypothetical protein
VDQRIGEAKAEIGDLAALKAKSFKDKCELAIVFERKTDSLRATPISINLSTIGKVTLRPWFPEPVTGIVRKIDGCAGLNVSRSSLVDSTRWRKAIH